MNNDLINIIGFFACAIVIYAGLESSLSKNKSKKKVLEEKEKMYKAKKDLAIAVKRRMEEKKFKNH